MTRSDSSTVISVLWLIAAIGEQDPKFAVMWGVMFAAYSIRAAVYYFADRKG